MSAGHSQGLYVHVQSAVHALPAHCKILALLLFVGAVAITPREALWVFALDATLAVVVARLAGVGLGFVARRLTIEIPFLLFALILPFIGGGETFELLDVTFYTDGAWAAWNIFAKATLGVTASILLAATTPPGDILRGLERLRTPALITTIAGFMVRYVHVVAGELRRMSIARVSRGYDPGWFRQLRVLGTTAGCLFVRSFERGERVYLAMVSRGFSGTMPAAVAVPTTARAWSLSLALPLIALVACSASWLAR